MSKGVRGVLDREVSGNANRACLGKHIPELDTIRGVGALAILANHFWQGKMFLGWTRVELFFVLSGYLVSSIVLKHGSGPRFLLAFLARRIVRTWPAYYMLIFIVSIRGMLDGNTSGLSEMGRYLTFTQNVAYCWSGQGSRFPYEAIQTWSLAIEEQFYVIWPLVGIMGGARWMMILGAYFVINSVIARLAGFIPIVALSRCDGLALGAILAAIFNSAEQTGKGRMWLRLGLLGAGISAVVFLVSPFAQLGDPLGRAACGPIAIVAISIVYCSIMGLVSLHSGHWLLRPLRVRVFRYLGQISYGIFLYHLVVIDVVLRWHERTPLVDGIAVVICVLVGAISWECLERPFGELKRFFPYEENERERRERGQGEKGGEREGGKGGGKGHFSITSSLIRFAQAWGKRTNMAGT